MHTRSLFTITAWALALATAVLTGCNDDNKVTHPGRSPMALNIPTDYSLAEAAAAAIPGDTLLVLFSPFPVDGTVTLSGTQTPLLVLGNKDRPTLSSLGSTEPILRFESPKNGTRISQIGFSGGDPSLEVDGAGRIAVESCKFTGGTVQIFGSGSGLQVDVTGCIMRNAEFFSIEMESGAKVTATGNTIDQAGDCGILLTSTTATVSRCIIWRSANFGIACNTEASLSLQSGCNDIHLSGVDPYLSCVPPGSDFNLDPLFCDPNNGNYSLQFGSPCDSLNSGCNAIVGALGVACAAP